MARQKKPRSEEHTSELQSRVDISYAVFCLKKSIGFLKYALKMVLVKGEWFDLYGFFCLAIIKGPPNDIYFIIEGPYDGYFTEKVSQALINQKNLPAEC